MLCFMRVIDFWLPVNWRTVCINQFYHIVVVLVVHSHDIIWTFVLISQVSLKLKIFSYKGNNYGQWLMTLFLSPATMICCQECDGYSCHQLHGFAEGGIFHLLILLLSQTSQIVRKPQTDKTTNWLKYKLKWKWFWCAKNVQ